MEKWEDKIKQHVNQTPPDELTNRINSTLQQLPARRRPYHKFYFTAIASISAFILLLAASLISPVVADTMRSVPIIGSVFEKVGSIGVQRGNEQGLTTLLGDQVKIEKHLFTFTESLYDGSEIHVGYIIESLDPTNSVAHLSLPLDLNLTINGKRIGSYGMGERGELLENGNYVGTISIRFRDEVPDSFLLGISPRQGRRWKVELPIELQGKSKSFLVNETRETVDMLTHYDKVTFFPTTTEITFRQITDIPSIDDEDPYMFMEYMIVDNEGRVLQPFGSGGSGSAQGDKFVNAYKYNFEPFEEIPESITLKPFISPFRTETDSGVRGKWEGNELTLSQGEMGTMTILSIEEVDGTITVKYEVEGLHLYEQSIALLLEDSSGNRFDSDIRPPNRLEGTINQYEAVFTPNQKLDELYFVTFKKDAPEFIKELEITIEFN